MATAISGVAAGVYLFVVLPHVHDFPMLVIMFAAPFIYAATAIASATMARSSSDHTWVRASSGVG